MRIIIGFWRFIARITRWSWLQDKLDKSEWLEKQPEKQEITMDKDFNFGKDDEEDEDEEEDFNNPKYNPYKNPMTLEFNN